MYCFTFCLLQLDWSVFLLTKVGGLLLTKSLYISYMLLIFFLKCVDMQTPNKKKVIPCSNNESQALPHLPHCNMEPIPFITYFVAIIIICQGENSIISIDLQERCVYIPQENWPFKILKSSKQLLQIV